MDTKNGTSDKWCNALFGAIYSLVLFFILRIPISKLFRILDSYLFNPSSMTSINFVIIVIFIGISPILLNLFLIYLFLKNVPMSKVNKFLKPNKFKIILTSIIMSILFILSYFRYEVVVLKGNF